MTQKRLIIVGFLIGIALAIFFIMPIPVEWLPLNMRFRTEYAAPAPAEPITPAVRYDIKAAGRAAAEGRYSEALRLSGQHALNGYAGAQSLLGAMYYGGRGVPEDRAEAVRWWKLAGAQGNAFAQTRIALCYRFGEGVPADLVESHRWALAAAEGGDADAQFMVSGMYAFGEGAPRNRNLGDYWLIRAANSGHPEAKKALAKIYPSPAEDIFARAFADPRLSLRAAMELSKAVAGEREPEAPHRRRYRSSDIAVADSLTSRVTRKPNYSISTHSLLDEESARRGATRQFGGSESGIGRDEGVLSARTGTPLAPAGDGYTAGGVYYAPSGPSGAVNTRTGEYIPTIPEP